MTAARGAAGSEGCSTDAMSGGNAEVKRPEKRCVSGRSGRAVKYVASEVGRGLRCRSEFGRAKCVACAEPGGWLAVEGLSLVKEVLGVLAFDHGLCAVVIGPDACAARARADSEELDRIRLSLRKDGMISDVGV